MTVAIGGAREAPYHPQDERPKVVAGADGAGPAPSALRVIELLSHSAGPMGRRRGCAPSL